MKHTTGPWTASKETKVYYCSQTGKKIESVSEWILDNKSSSLALVCSVTKASANAQLMAAAPDLLQALLYAIELIPKPTLSDKNVAETLATLAYIDEVINNATKES